MTNGQGYRAEGMEMASEILVSEDGPHKFSLVVVWDGQRFDCGNYISRTAAQLAGRLFVQRKEGEQASGRKRPKKKP